MCLSGISGHIAAGLVSQLGNTIKLSWMSILIWPEMLLGHKTTTNIFFRYRCIWVWLGPLLKVFSFIYTIYRVASNGYILYTCVYIYRKREQVAYWNLSMIYRLNRSQCGFLHTGPTLWQCVFTMTLSRCRIVIPGHQHHYPMYQSGTLSIH